MHDISFVDPQINNIANQEISIQVSLSGFSFSVHAEETKQCLLFRHYRIKNIMLIDELIRKVEQLITTDSYLGRHYNSAKIYYISRNVTLVPQEYFDENQLKTYFEFNQNLAELDEIHYTLISEVGAYNVFSVHSYLTNIFYSRFKDVSFKHQSSNLIRYGKKVFGNKNQGVLLGINKGFFDIVVFENGNLVLSNSFEYTNEMDFIYFYLYTLKQLKVDTSKIKVILFGEELEHKRFIDDIKDQTGNSVIPDIESPKICRNITPLQAAQYFNLFL